MSKSVKLVYGGRRNRIIHNEKLNKTGRQLTEERTKRQRLFAGTFIITPTNEETRHSGVVSALSYQDRDAFLASGSSNRSFDVAMDDDTGWEDEEAAFTIPPPGEEGSFHSHAGDEELFNEIVNGAKSKRCVSWI